MARWITGLESGPQRVNHSAVAIGHRIFSFGGYCTGEDYNFFRPIDVHILNTVSLRWTTVCHNWWIVPHVPFQRYGHTAVAYHDLVLIWGGRNDVRACNLLYIFDTTDFSWYHPPTTGIVPSARDGHAASLLDEYMYVFGGYEEELKRFSQELYRLNLLTWHWEYLIPQGQPPSWRDFHSMVTLGPRLYVFGGRGDDHGTVHTQNDVYCNKIVYFDSHRMCWVTPPTKGQVPIGRRSHSCFVYQQRLYFFGGYNGNYDIHFDDLYCYDPETATWSKITPRGNNGPCPRRRQCTCIIDSKAYIFGGTSPDTNATVEPTGELEVNLRDHADLFILDFFPSLKMLCIVEILRHGLDQSSLPKDLIRDINILTTPTCLNGRSFSNMG